MEGVVKPRARQHTFPILRDAGSVWSQYRQNGSIPLNYVIDAGGTVRHWMEGFDENAIRNVITQYVNIQHDVGVIRIVAPTGIKDSGTQVTPVCSLFNSGRNTESYPVQLRIGANYSEVLQITSHQPGAAIGVSFPTWTALSRGVSAIRCSTGLTGDMIPGNDMRDGQVTVQVFDVAALAILTPSESLDSGAVVTPRAVVANHGTGIQRVYVKLRIGDFYSDSVRPSLAPGAADTVEFRSWTADRLGEFPVNCSAAAPRDLVPLNNRLLGTVRIVRCAAVAESPDPAAPGARLWGEPALFRDFTRVRWQLPVPAPVRLDIFSTDGQLVRSFCADAGGESAVWDGRDRRGLPVPAGVYCARLAAAGQSSAVLVLRID
jgi:hypothetical protein